MPEPRIVCATCGTDLGTPRLVASDGLAAKWGWKWDATPAEPHDCPDDQEDQP